MILPLFGVVPLSPFSLEDWGVILEFRLPRLLAAWMIGALLSLSGLIFQAMLRNPLADPYILGVASGGALGAAVVLHFGLSFSFWLLSAPAIGAFIGALLITLLLYLIAFWRSFSPLRLILLGVMLNFFCSSLILLLQALGEPSRSYELMHWLMGRIGFITGEELLLLTELSLGALLFSLFIAPRLNLLALGPELAQLRGLRVKRIAIALFLVISLLLGVLVALSGPIGFVGLIIPHIARFFVGEDYRKLSWLVFPLGGSFLMLAQWLSTTLFPPAELPLGVVTALLGAPFFLMLLFRRNGVP